MRHQHVKRLILIWKGENEKHVGKADLFNIGRLAHKQKGKVSVDRCNNPLFSVIALMVSNMPHSITKLIVV